MSLSTPGGPPPGWYPNPNYPTRLRWWDGSHWGPDAPVTPQTLPGSDRPERGLPLGATRSVSAQPGWPLGLGIAALVLAWVPVFGVLLAAVGLLRAILELAFGTRGPKVAWGAVLSGIALFIGISVTSTIGSEDAETPAAVESTPSETKADEPSSGPKRTEKPESKPSPKEEPQAAGVGDPVRDGKFEFTVTKVEAGVAEIGDEYFGEKAQGQFVLIHMKVKNIGDEVQTFYGGNVTAFDADEREFSSDTEAAFYLDESNSFFNDINPGNAAKGIVVFDIPKDTKIAALELHDSFFSGGVTVAVS